MMKQRLIVMLVAVGLVTVLGIAGTVLGQEEPAAPGFTLTRMVVGSGVENLEPVGVADSFPAGGQVFAFIEVNNIKADTTVTFVWFFQGEERHRYSLPIKAGSRWRTYASKNVFGFTGEWTVQLRDASGEMVTAVDFTVQ